VLERFSLAGAAPRRATALVWHELFLWHDPGMAGPPGSHDLAIEPGDVGEETPEPRRRLRNLIEVSGLREHLRLLAPHEADEQALSYVHTEAYLRHVTEAGLAGGGLAGEVTPVGREGHRFAALAAGGCIAAVDAVLGGKADNAYALVRPAGHHALPDRGRGFCIYNNVAIAARHAQRAHGVQRIAIVDWDAHHGNGTQAIFYEEAEVLTISLHQADWYPRGEGSAGERGAGAGRGANLNVALPPGSGSGAYAAAIERVVLPALDAHGPELIIVACGLDASAADPSARMMLTSEDFRSMTRAVAGAAEALCGGRLVACQEGGYSAVYAPFCGLAVLEELAGLRTAVQDPFLARYTGCGFVELQAHQAAVIDEAAQQAGLTGRPAP